MAKKKQKQKQGRIHGNPVADGWAGAVMQKPLANQKSDRPTDRPTDLPTYRPSDTAKCRVACPRLKKVIKKSKKSKKSIIFTV